jgi:hypothetical protein
MIKRQLVSFIIVALVVSTAGIIYADQRPEKAAQRAAESWMPMLDSGKYAESWDELAEYTKARTDKKAWELFLIAARKPFGELKSRKLKGTKFFKSLAELPDQSGMTLEYESSFEHSNCVIETFGLILENDGTWRVSNYSPRDLSDK